MPDSASAVQAAPRAATNATAQRKLLSSLGRPSLLGVLPWLKYWHKQRRCSLRTLMVQAVTTGGAFLPVQHAAAGQYLITVRALTLTAGSSSTSTATTTEKTTTSATQVQVLLVLGPPLCERMTTIRCWPFSAAREAAQRRLLSGLLCLRLLLGCLLRAVVALLQLRLHRCPRPPLLPCPAVARRLPSLSVALLHRCPLQRQLVVVFRPG